MWVIGGRSGPGSDIPRSPLRVVEMVIEVRALNFRSCLAIGLTFYGFSFATICIDCPLSTLLNDSKFTCQITAKRNIQNCA